MYLISKEERSLRGEIKISGSKSESNRLLILRAYTSFFKIFNLSDSDDTNTMISALKSEDEVLSNKDVKGYIFDGFPRTLNQAESLDFFLESINLNISATIALDVSEDELISRLLERGKITNRSDDQDVDKIKNRFNEYNNKTSILINFYKNQDKFYSVDGKGSVDDITSRLFNLIDSLI